MQTMTTWGAVSVLAWLSLIVLTFDTSDRLFGIHSCEQNIMG